ncbi:rhomboid family intramembrane serine protease [Ectobacillus ponti]|uniref:Rhomboid family intramembrane serine protease n=1 Tax=Ectobacillus ponti TaxID=2961894 RepID=A0AA41X4P3_9BACI|nr:rhomboid family intramembrane serine protease [Ectobacillus ponti]MCP8967128.1 rhomboid family intramembrane serine protease [Ectobacillus ponti]
MRGTQDSLYWALLYLLVSLRKYELLHYSTEDQEAWLEGSGPGGRRLLRLKRHDVDWSRWLREDMIGMYPAAKQLSKQGFGKGAHIYNVYVSQWEPLDDWYGVAEEIGQRLPVSTVFLTERNEKEQLEFFRDALQLDVEEQRTLAALCLEEPEVLRYRLAYVMKQQQKKREDVLQYARPLVTKSLIALQLVMFALLELFGGSQNISTLLAFGAKSNALILQGEWWRFFTPMVLHIGLLHLLMNTLALYYIGSQLERVIGNLRFLVIYLFAGAAGSVLSFVFSDSISAGASGAIFGCFSALLYVVRIHSAVFPRSVMQSILTLIGINLLFGFVVPGIDNAGHIGGLLGGFLMAAAVHVPQQKGVPAKRIGALAAAVLLCGAALWYGYAVRGKDPQVPVTKAGIQMPGGRSYVYEKPLQEMWHME